MASLFVVVVPDISIWDMIDFMSVEDEIRNILDALGSIDDGVEKSLTPRDFDQRACSRLRRLSEQMGGTSTMRTMRTNYNFMYWNLRNLIDRFEGWTCCADKARTIMNALWERELHGGQERDPDPGPDPSWNVPRHFPEWVALALGLVRLTDGSNVAYLRALVDIERMYASEQDEQNA